MSIHPPGSFEWAKDQVKAGKVVISQDSWNCGGEYYELVEYKPDEWRTRSVGYYGWETDHVQSYDRPATDWRIVELTLGEEK